MADGDSDGVGGTGVSVGGKAVALGVGEPGKVGKMKTVLVGAAVCVGSGVGEGAGVSVSAGDTGGNAVEAARLGVNWPNARLVVTMTTTVKAATMKNRRKLDIYSSELLVKRMIISGTAGVNAASGSALGDRWMAGALGRTSALQEQGEEIGNGDGHEPGINAVKHTAMAR
jgi:hypothetical protein